MEGGMIRREGIELIFNVQQEISNFQVVVTYEISVKSIRGSYLDIGHFCWRKGMLPGLTLSGKVSLVH